MRSRSLLTHGLLVFGAALALRLCIAAAYPPAGTPEIAFYRGDAPAYHRYAASVAAGVPYDQGLPFHPPLLAWLAAPVYRGAGDGEALFVLLRGLLSVVGAGVAVLALLVGRRLAGPAVGLGAGVLVALHFGLGAAATTLNADNLNAALALGGILLLLAAPALEERSGKGRNLLARAGLRYPAAAGVLAGLAALARAEDQLLVLLLAAWVAWRARGGVRGGALDAARSGGALLAGALLVILPWAVRNAAVIDSFNRTRAGAIAAPLGRFAPVTCYGGLNFALGNHPQSTGGFSRRPLEAPGGSATLDLGREQHVDFLNRGLAIGLGYIARDPVAWARLAVRKLAIGLDALRLGYGARNRPAGLAGTRRAVDFMSPDRRWLLLPHALAIIAGIVVLRRRAGGAAVWLLHLPCIVKLIALVAFFGYVRLTLTILPVLLIDVAAALGAAVGWAARRARPGRRRAAAGRWLGTAAAALILALALVEGLDLAARGQEMGYAGESELGSSRVNLDGDLRIWPLDPDGGEPRAAPGP